MNGTHKRGKRKSTKKRLSPWQIAFDEAIDLKTDTDTEENLGLNDDVDTDGIEIIKAAPIPTKSTYSIITRSRSASKTRSQQKDDNLESSEIDNTDNEQCARAPKTNVWKRKLIKKHQKKRLAETESDPDVGKKRKKVRIGKPAKQEKKALEEETKIQVPKSIRRRQTHSLKEETKIQVPISGRRRQARSLKRETTIQVPITGRRRQARSLKRETTIQVPIVGRRQTRSLTRTIAAANASTTYTATEKNNKNSNISIRKQKPKDNNNKNSNISIRKQKPKDKNHKNSNISMRKQKPKVKRGRVAKRAPKQKEERQQKQRLEKMLQAIQHHRVEVADYKQKAEKQRRSLTQSAADAAVNTVKSFANMATKLKNTLFSSGLDLVESSSRFFRNTFSTPNLMNIDNYEWPNDPVYRVAKTIRQIPRWHSVVDFYTGKPHLAKLLPQAVRSINLTQRQSTGDEVSERLSQTELKAESQHVAAFCMSLSGNDIRHYIFEASRVLKVGGQLFILEMLITSDDLLQFERGISACGFDLCQKKIIDNLYYFYSFRKSRKLDNENAITPFTLTACKYRLVN